MERYKKPQIYIINNSSIAEKLSERYIVAEGDLGLRKRVEYKDYEETRYLNLEFNISKKLHEYEVRIIDMQEKQDEIIISEDEEPNTELIFKMSYPNKIFNPIPLVMERINEFNDGGNLTIIFVDSDVIENYQIAEVRGQRGYRSLQDFKSNSNLLLNARTKNKEGERFQYENYNLANIIFQHVYEYKVIFELPKVFGEDNREYVRSQNYIPLLTNHDGEIISYLGYDGTTGYELILPICKDKEQLIDKLLSQVLPEIIPKIFPESQEFIWVNNDYFKCKKTLQLEESIKDANKKHQDHIKTIEKEIQQIKEKNMFFTELLTETGDRLVIAVKSFLQWLGFSEVKLVDKEKPKVLSVSKVLREDLQILLDDFLFIIEVKGIGGTSTDSDCSQIGKHRRRREKQFPDKKIIPIYIVNHQRYMNPKQRENPPFSKDQIDYAQNDERGLLTTWEMYKKYKYIEEGIFTKEEVRKSFNNYGVLDLIPDNMQEIGKVNEYFKKSKACILELNGVEVSLGDEIICNKGDEWYKGRVESLQKNDEPIKSAQTGEIGLVLDIELGLGYILYKRT